MDEPEIAGGVNEFAIGAAFWRAALISPKSVVFPGVLIVMNSTVL